MPKEKINKSSTLIQSKKVKDKQDEMMETGLHLGHRTSRLHPHMENFVVGIRNTVHVIDLEKTEQYLEKALKFLSEIAKNKGTVLFVSTKTPLKQLVKETAEECKMPYVVDRWLGGTFTNFGVVQKRAKYYQELKDQKAGGQFEKYTKKERIDKEKDLQKMGLKFEGIVNLEKLPEAVFICDIVKDDLALKESTMKNVPSIAIVDSNADPMLVDYPIPGNDDAISAVKYILDKVKEALTKEK